MGRRLKLAHYIRKIPARKGWDFFCNSKFKIQNLPFYIPLPM